LRRLLLAVATPDRSSSCSLAFAHSRHARRSFIHRGIPDRRSHLVRRCGGRSSALAQTAQTCFSSYVTQVPSISCISRIDSGMRRFGRSKSANPCSQKPLRLFLGSLSLTLAIQTDNLLCGTAADGSSSARLALRRLLLIATANGHLAAGARWYALAASRARDSFGNLARFACSIAERSRDAGAPSWLRPVDTLRWQWAVGGYSCAQPARPRSAMRPSARHGVLVQGMLRSLSLLKGNGFQFFDVRQILCTRAGALVGNQIFQ